MPVSVEETSCDFVTPVMEGVNVKDLLTFEVALKLVRLRVADLECKTLADSVSTLIVRCCEWVRVSVNVTERETEDVSEIVFSPTDAVMLAVAWELYVLDRDKESDLEMVNDEE